ncbi:MAG: hypothetical protein ACI9Y1_002658 [Lentisphaeria bacterium]|jgi:hypothetical protein
MNDIGFIRFGLLRGIGPVGSGRHFLQTAEEVHGEPLLLSTYFKSLKSQRCTNMLEMFEKQSYALHGKTLACIKRQLLWRVVNSYIGGRAGFMVYARVSQHYDIEVITDDDKKHARNIMWSRKQGANKKPDLSGAYCLRTNNTDLSEKAL